MIILNGVICMGSFLLGFIGGIIAVTLFFVLMASGKISREEEKYYTEEIDEVKKRKQELQEQQIDDFSRMMSYDVEIAYDIRNEV